MSSENLPIVLIIKYVLDEDWYQLCEDCKDKFRIVQAPFEDISISSYENFPMVTIYPPKIIRYEFQKSRIKIKPDLILVRSCVQYVSTRLGVRPDFRNVLYGLIHANVPMINSFNAVLYDLERPIMFGILKGIQKKLGAKNFPLIPQTYYSESQEMVISPEPPFVIKYSFPHAGYGKICVKDTHDFSDIKSLVAIDNHYCAAEPLIDSEYELRIAFIAPDFYRVHKRSSMNWKVNYGGPNIREDAEMTPMFKMWVDEVRNAIPGMDCFSIDAIVDKKGNTYILEVNGSAQGFPPEHEAEYLDHLKKLVISRLDEVMKNKSEEPKPPKTESDLSLENLNLKNEIDYLKAQLAQKDKKIDELQMQDQKKKKKK